MTPAPTPTAPPTSAVTLVLVPVADPLARHGRPDREPVVRLRAARKALLRSYGWRCTACRFPRPTDPTTTPEGLE